MEMTPNGPTSAWTGLNCNICIRCWIRKRAETLWKCSLPDCLQSPFRFESQISNHGPIYSHKRNKRKRKKERKKEDESRGGRKFWSICSDFLFFSFPFPFCFLFLLFLANKKTMMALCKRKESRLLNTQGRIRAEKGLGWNEAFQEVLPRSLEAITRDGASPCRRRRVLPSKRSSLSLFGFGIWIPLSLISSPQDLLLFFDGDVWSFQKEMGKRLEMT